jgi:hypothetical protein
VTELTLNEFVLARIGERETLAREAYTRDWDGDKRTYYTGAEHHRDDWGVWMFHIPPKQVLTECQTWRRIVEPHPTRWIYVEASRKMGEESPQVECVGGPVYDDEVRILGEVYAAHEDYREEWAA